ncbi:MAG: hypothetical protein OEM41_07665, partial [Ignavibacteria bacterium]|nr:hypothetical protein [Ignavibacteria bacterium]
LAKMYLLSHGKADPFYWGPFTLTGDPSPVNFDSPNSNSQAIIQALAIMGMVLIVSLLLRRLLPFYRTSSSRRLHHQDVR